MSEIATPDIKEKIKVKKPNFYKVVFLNDDYTPFEFVIMVLEQIFHHSTASALLLAQEIHKQGKGVAGTYIFEIAEQKQEDTIKLARMAEYPLRVVLEEG